MKFTLTFLSFLAINLGALFLGTLLVPCLNDDPNWVALLAKWIQAWNDKALTPS